MTDSHQGPSLPKILWIFSAVVCMIAIVGGFSLTGGPGYQRLHKQDEERITQLQEIERGIDQFIAQKKRLPSNLPEIQAEKTIYIDPDQYRDPITEKPFEYIPQETKYQLCAEFETSSESRKKRQNYSHYGNTAYQWQHPKGRHCIYFDASSKLKERAPHSS